MRKLLPVMIQNKFGHIVNIGSTVAFLTAPSLADYCSSKWALYSMHEALRIELEVNNVKNIGMTVINPWVINTGMFKGFYNTLEYIIPTLTPEGVGLVIYKSII